MEALIVDIQSIPIPSHHLTTAIEQPTQFHAQAPTSFVLAFLAHLLSTAPLPNGKE